MLVFVLLSILIFQIIYAFRKGPVVVPRLLVANAFYSGFLAIFADQTVAFLVVGTAPSLVFLALWWKFGQRPIQPVLR